MPIIMEPLDMYDQDRGYGLYKYLLRSVYRAPARNHLNSLGLCQMTESILDGSNMIGLVNSMTVNRQ